MRVFIICIPNIFWNKFITFCLSISKMHLFPQNTLRFLQTVLRFKNIKFTSFPWTKLCKGNLPPWILNLKKITVLIHYVFILFSRFCSLIQFWPNILSPSGPYTLGRIAPHNRHFLRKSYSEIQDSKKHTFADLSSSFSSVRQNFHLRDCHTKTHPQEREKHCPEYHKIVHVCNPFFRRTLQARGFRIHNCSDFRKVIQCIYYILFYVSH